MKSKVITALLSVAIAFALWAYVVTVVSPESENTYYNVPVVLDGQSLLEERDLMIVSDRDFKVNLTLSGNRTDLNKLSSANITLLADLSAITEPGVHTLNYTVSYPGSVQSGTIHTMNQDPQQIQLTVVERGKKDIPVKVSPVTVETGYTLQSVTLDHTTVTISGPKDVVDKITQAKLDLKLDKPTQTVTTSAPITLCGEDGEPIVDVSSITVNVSNIRATVVIRQLKEISLELNVIPGGGITEDMAIILPNRTSITVSGSETALKDLEKIVLGDIDLGKLTGDTTLAFDVVLPSGVTNVTGVTTVTVEVRMPVMASRTYTVTRFEAINKPADMQVEFLTEQLLVEMRGPVGVLDTLTAEDLVAVVDFTDAQPGSASYAVTIRVEGVEGVGAVGTIEPVNAQLIAASEGSEG